MVEHRCSKLSSLIILISIFVAINADPNLTVNKFISNLTINRQAHCDCNRTPTITHGDDYDTNTTFLCRTNALGFNSTGTIIINIYYIKSYKLFLNLRL